VTELEGEMLHGRSITEIVVEHEEPQLYLEILSVRVNEPTEVAFTVTVNPVLDPEIVPFPVIDQRCVTLSDGLGVLVKILLVEPAKTEVFPEIAHWGVGFTFNVRFLESLVTLQSAPEE